MAINPNEDTEFNEALRKHGILPPREPTPPSPSPPPSPTFSDLLDDFTSSELQELAADAADDTAERAIERHRRERLLQEAKEARRARFGEVIPIGRDDYTREVTEASQVDEEGDDKGRGTGVVCFLYKDGIPRSDRAFQHIRTLAKKHPRTKFVSIVGDKCLPNLPDTRVPMFIVYRKGDIVTQVVSWGADRDRKIEELEALLIVAGAIIPPERRPPGKSRGDNDDSDGEDVEDHDRSSRMRSTSTWTNHTSKNVRNSEKKEDDSDSDFDL
ncbi:thioredoxin-like protein [Amylostereum chailletii]|nr:thioredoxin-like protein [Amylostereum chailletii]